MGRKKISIVLVTCFLSISVLAQQDSSKQFIHKGLLRGALTYSVGMMSELTISNIYVTGNLEYYADNKVSIRGDGCFFVSSLNDNRYLKQNHQVFFGACYNFPVKSRLNPFIGFQPGVAISRINFVYGLSDPGSIGPVASVVTGFNYYAEKWFHVLINVRYVVGQHLDEVALFSLNEVSFSFGLGWNLDVLKKHS